MKKYHLKSSASFVALTALSVPILYSSGIGCPIRHITGIPCPFCGTTRAFIRLIKGDVKTAHYYHPLILITPLFFIILVYYLYKPSQKTMNILIGFAILYFIIYIIRLTILQIP